MLTGKAKEKFEKYFSKEIYLKDFEIKDLYLGLDDFLNLTLSMQFGVYQDFAESEGYYLEFYLGYYDGYVYGYKVYEMHGSEPITDTLLNDTKQEAREEAIKQLFKL